MFCNDKTRTFKAGYYSIRLSTLLVLCMLNTEYYYNRENLEEITQSATSCVVKQSVLTTKTEFWKRRLFPFIKKKLEFAI